MQLELGMGTSPASSVVVGGVVKSLTFFGRGTDMALAVRGATGGFARGEWGMALDVGPFQRWWGVANATGIGASLSLGAPFGLQASAIFEEGNHDARVLAFVVGIDLMRMSVYRTAGLSWMPNPMTSPALGR